MKIRDILGEDDVKIEPAPSNMQQVKNANGDVIATGPADKLGAVQQAAKDGVDFTPGTDQQASEDYEMEEESGVYPSRNPGTPAAADAAAQAANPSKIQSAVYPSRNTQEAHHDLISQGNHDVGGDATDDYINQVRDKDFERAQHEGIFGLGNKSPEEWAKTSPQMSTLLQFQQKYQGTPYAEQIAKRIQLLKDRLDMDAGEVAGPGGTPKPVVPPDQFDMKQLKESDDALLEKMRMIAGLR